MMKWGKLGLTLGGFLLGTYGTKILGSRDAKKAYTQMTAAALRMKDQVLSDYTVIRENCEDILAEARDINEQREAEDEALLIEDAKAILEEAGVKA